MPRLYCPSPALPRLSCADPQGLAQLNNHFQPFTPLCSSSSELPVTRAPFGAPRSLCGASANPSPSTPGSVLPLRLALDVQRRHSPHVRLSRRCRGWQAEEVAESGLERFDSSKFIHPTRVPFQRLQRLGHARSQVLATAHILEIYWEIYRAHTTSPLLGRSRYMGLNAN